MNNERKKLEDVAAAAFLVLGTLPRNLKTLPANFQAAIGLLLEANGEELTLTPRKL